MSVTPPVASAPPRKKKTERGGGGGSSSGGGGGGGGSLERTGGLTNLEPELYNQLRGLQKSARELRQVRVAGVLVRKLSQLIPRSAKLSGLTPGIDLLCSVESSVS
jgi:hypothetical protein